MVMRSSFWRVGIDGARLEHAINDVGLIREECIRTGPLMCF